MKQVCVRLNTRQYIARTELKKPLFVVGGDDWPEQYELCGKDKQTPVNIKGAKCDVALANSITFKNYKNKGEKKFKVLNTGGTMKVTTASTDASIILDGKGTFKLQQVHFHWGKNDSEGSEHLLNDKAFPAEVMYAISFRNQRSTKM